jgi:hypothetical protein
LLAAVTTATFLVIGSPFNFTSRNFYNLMKI